MLLGTPRLTLPVMPAGAMPTWRRPWHMWPRYLIASIVEVQLAVLLAVVLEAAELDDRLPWALKVMPPPLSVYAAVYVEPSGHVWWRSWPLPGSLRLPPPIPPAGGMPACCCVLYIGPRYSLAFSVVIRLALMMFGTAQEITLQLAEVAPQAAVLPLMAAVQVARPV